MGKLSAGFDLGTELRTHRKAAGLTQPNLATKAGLAERTVRALELGSGTLNSWNVALDALERVSRDETCRAARRSANGSRRFAAVGGSRRRNSPARSG